MTAIGVTCPVCSAGPGVRCRSPQRGTPYARLHMGRINAYRAQPSTEMVVVYVPRQDLAAVYRLLAERVSVRG